MYDQFLKYIRCELAMSARTVSSYTSDLKIWREWADEVLGPDFDPTRTRLNDLRMWIASQASRGVSARSIKRRMSAMRSFFRFLCDRYGMESNPAADIITARIPRTLPNVIRPEETKKILDAPIDESDFLQVRNRLIILTLYSTGMRASELTGMLDVNVDTSSCELKVLGKRNKERIIPFGPEMSAMISRYRSLRPVDAPRNFFIEEDGSALTYQHLRRIVRGELVGRVKASKPTPHALRHSFATDMLNGGATLTSVQQLLGHSSLATTQIYTHLSYSELQTNYQHAHPRAQKK